MKFIFEQYSPPNNSAQNLPFYGKDSTSFTSSRSNFTPGIAIKFHQLKDRSTRTKKKFTTLENFISKLRHYVKPGDKVKGILINSQHKSSTGIEVVGKLKNIDINPDNSIVRTFIQDQETLKVYEIYTESAERVYENTVNNKYIKTFESFDI